MKVKGKVCFGPSDIVYDMTEVEKAWNAFTAGKRTIPLHLNFTDEVVGSILVEGCSIEKDGVHIEAETDELPRGMGAKCQVIRHKLLPRGKMLVKKMLIEQVSTVDEPLEGGECEKID